MGLKRRTNGDSGRSSGDKPTIVCENLEENKEYEARLVYVADLGLHENSYKGEVKPDVQKVALGYEILGETVEIDGVEKPRMMWDMPFNIYWKMDEKGKEYAYYKIFNPSAEPDTIADWESVLGTPVSITVKHVSDKKDHSIKYDNIASVQAIPKKYQKGVAEGTIKPCIGDADDPNNDATKALYGLTKWMFDRRRMVREPVVKDVEDTNFVVDNEDLPF